MAQIDTEKACDMPAHSVGQLPFLTSFHDRLTIAHDSSFGFSRTHLPWPENRFRSIDDPLSLS
jgi:hypothetical protein